MTIPDYQAFMRPVLEAFDGGAENVKQTLPHSVEALGLSREQAEKLMADGKQTVVSNRAHWARTYLSNAGLLESPRRNLHVITAKGRAYLERYPAGIDKNTLLLDDGFRDWIESSQNPRSRTDLSEDTAVQPAFTSNDVTPEEAITDAVSSLNLALIEEVLAATLELSPPRFERLILDLLRAMG